MEIDRKKLLLEVRDIADGQLGRIVAKVMDQTDDALFSMADKAETNQLQSLYFDAMREVRLKRPAIESGTHAQFLDTFEHRIRPPDVIAKEQQAGGLALGLVDMDELEESLAVDNMVTKLRDSAHESLDALDMRMGYLLSRADLGEDCNPIGPDVICRSFQEACQSVESGIEVKLIVFKLFDRYAFKEILGLYDELNAFLAGNNVLRELPFKERLVKTRPEPRARATGESVEEEQAAEGGTPGQGSVAGGGGDVFTVLQRLLAGSGMTAAGGGGSAVAGMGGGGFGMAGAGGAPGVAGRGGAGVPGGGALPTGAVVTDLTALQRGGQASGVLAGVGQEVVPVDASGIPGNVLQSLRASGALGSGTADAATLDIVAMMFDYILDDDAMPDAVKAQLARLQIPMLKVALLDRSVFSNKHHPARALLDTLAAAGVGLREDEPLDRPLLGRIAEVTQRIVDEFEDDLGLFKEFLREFQAFLEQELANAEEAVESTAAGAADEERGAIARNRAEQEVRKRLDRPRVPVLVGQFLDQTWRQVLEQTAQADGRGAGTWKLEVETMDILLWSLEPKASASERRRLVGLLPELLRRLKDGTRRIGLSDQDCNHFISTLAPLHARAVKPLEEVGTEPVLPLLEDEPDSVSPAPEEPSVSLPDPDPEFLAIVGELEKGTWLEFAQDDGGRLRARLSWVSSISGLYLFTDRKGFKVLERTPRELALELADGSARLIEDEPLFDRAVANLMDVLDAAAA